MLFYNIMTLLNSWNQFFREHCSKNHLTSASKNDVRWAHTAQKEQTIILLTLCIEHWTTKMNSRSKFSAALYLKIILGSKLLLKIMRPSIFRISLLQFGCIIWNCNFQIWKAQIWEILNFLIVQYHECWNSEICT